MNASPRSLHRPTGLLAGSQEATGAGAHAAKAAGQAAAGADAFRTILGSALLHVTKGASAAQAGATASAGTASAAAAALATATPSASATAAGTARAASATSFQARADAQASTAAALSALGAATPGAAQGAGEAASAAGAAPGKASARRDARRTGAPTRTSEARAAGAAALDQVTAATTAATGFAAAGLAPIAPAAEGTSASRLAGTANAAGARAGALSAPGSKVSALHAGSEGEGAAEPEGDGDGASEVKAHPARAALRRNSAQASEVAQVHAVAPAPAPGASAAAASSEARPSAEAATRAVSGRLTRVKSHQASAADVGGIDAQQPKGARAPAKASPRTTEERHLAVEEDARTSTHAEAPAPRREAAAALQASPTLTEGRTSPAQALTQPAASDTARAALPAAPAGQDVQGAVMKNAAHLRLDAGDLGVIELHLRVREGALHLRVEGDGARTLQAQAGELSRSLASEGLKLAPIEASTPDHAALPGGAEGGRSGQERREAWAEVDDARHRAPAAVASSSDDSSDDGTARNRVHVTA